MSTVNDAANNFSFFMGAFGILSTIISFIIFMRFLLPSAVIKKLDDAYIETSDIYLKGVAEGLLPDAKFRSEIEVELATYDNLRTGFRERVFQALSIWDEFRGLLDGLTSGIRDTTFGLRQLRCRIVTTTQETRRKMEQQRQHEHATFEDGLLSRSSTLVFNTSGEDRSNFGSNLMTENGECDYDISDMGDLRTVPSFWQRLRFSISRMRQQKRIIQLPVDSRSGLKCICSHGVDTLISGCTLCSTYAVPSLGRSLDSPSTRDDARPGTNSRPEKFNVPTMEFVPPPPPALTLSALRILEYEPRHPEA